MKELYSTAVTATEGRSGHVRSDDGLIDFGVSLPSSMGGRGDMTNPEQLFGAGYSACFGGAVALVAKKHGATLTKNQITANVGLHRKDTGELVISVHLNALLAGVDQATAERIVEEAHKVCPYSNATRNNVDVKLSAQVE